MSKCWNSDCRREKLGGNWEVETALASHGHGPPPRREAGGDVVINKQRISLGEKSTWKQNLCGGRFAGRMMLLEFLGVCHASKNSCGVKCLCARACVCSSLCVCVCSVGIYRLHPSSGILISLALT